MAVNYDELGNKIENDGGTSQGKLTAKEWNDFVGSVKSHESSINTLKRTSIKGVKFNGQVYNEIVDGILNMPVDESARTVELTWNDTNSNEPDDITIANNASLMLYYLIKDVDVDGKPFIGKGILNVYVDDSRVHSIVNVGHGSTINFDLMKVAGNKLSSDGQYVIKLEYDNNNKIEYKRFIVNIVSLILNVTNFKNYYAYNTTSWPIAYITNNSTLHYNISNANYDNISGSVPFTYTEVNLEQVLRKSRHGVNNVSLWCTINLENGEVTTDKQYFKYIFVEENNNDTIIMSNVLNGDSFDLYNNINIGFTAYVAGITSGKKDVKVGLYKNNTRVLDEVTVSVDILNNIGNGVASFSLVPNDVVTINDILGINKIKISVDDYVDETNIKINKVDVSYKEVPNYDVFFNADNKSNQISHEWVSSGFKQIAMEFENVPFIDGASGWYVDNEKGTSLKLKRGSYCTLNYLPFETNPAYNNGDNSGLTISIEFATSNCFKDNAPVVTCMNGERGFEVTASDAKLKSSNKTLRAKFKENTRLRLDFVIEGIKTGYTQKSWVPTDPANPSKGQTLKNEPSNEAMMFVYCDGVYAGLAEYGTSNGTDFKQVIPQAIKFGSDMCDIDIYKIRIYKKALSCVEIVNNYAYDANGVANKNAIALRNDIFVEGQGNKRNKPDININKLKSARPELPIFTVRLDDKHHVSEENEVMKGELTNNKSDWQLCSLSEFANPMSAIKDKDVALNSWQANTGTIRNQGTSSMGYPWPWRNWDWKTGDTDHGTSKDDMLFYFPTLDSDVTSKSWSQYPYKWSSDVTLMKKLTLKKDYASSEMCNNAICSELYNDFAVMLATKYVKYVDSLLTDKMRTQWNSSDDNGGTKKSTDYRFALKAKPCFMIQDLSYNPNGAPEDIRGTAGMGKDALGMMNLIPNKNEVKYLGFSKNRWEDNDWEEINGVVKIKEGEGIDVVENREQAWELRENKDGVYWRYHIDPAHMENGVFVNEIFDHYEARTPKDSPIFDDTDFGDIDSNVFDEKKHLDAMVDQTKDLCRLHNWFVDTNRELATGKKIKDLYKAEEYAALKQKYGYSDEWDERYDLRDNGPDVNGNTYESWRLLRFKTEAKDYLIEKQWILYYLWREMFWMFDSGFKNLQVYTLDGIHWGTMVRDADTALGIENTGKDYFAPHLEDIDGYKIVDGVTQYGYGTANGLYYSGELTEKGYGAVLNGQFGSVWVNIRDAWKDNVAEMVNDLKAAGVTSDFVINRFRNHQENWCESLYNFGMRQYFGGDAYLNNISAGLGDKKHSRAQWLERGIYYRQSKYKAFDSGDYMYCRRGKQKPLWVSFDGNDNNKTPLSSDEQTKVTFKSYIPTYIWTGGDEYIANNNNAFRLIDINNDKEYTAVVDVASNGMNLPDHGVDANTAVYGMRYITDMGELFKYCSLTNNPITLNMPMLRNLEFGHDSRRDGKKYWTFTDGVYSNLENNDSRVQNINLSLMTGLSVLDMTNHRSLNTINGLDKCTQLEEVYISGTNVNTLNLPQTSTIKKLYLNDKLTNITLDNLINLEDVQIDGYNNITTVKITNCNSYMQSKSADIVANCIGTLSSCELTNINWNSFGNNNVGTRDYEILEKLVDIKAILKGTITISKMTPALKLKLINQYGDVDTNTGGNESLHIVYDKSNLASVQFNRNEYYLEPGQSSFDFSNELSFNPTGANSIYKTEWSIDDDTNAAINSITGVITRKDNNEYDKPVNVTVTIYQHTGGALGYNEIITATTVVQLKEHIAKPGDIVYADGSFSSDIIESATPIGICFYVDPNNHKNRLMHAIDYATSGDNNTKYYTWGVGNYYSSIQNSASQSPLGFNKNLYDIDGINNYSSLGVNIYANQTGANVFDTDYIVESNDSYTFKTYDTGAVSEIGFTKVDKDINVFNSYNEYEQKNPTTICKANDIIPFGLYNTLQIINTRNKFLLNIDSYSVNNGTNGNNTDYNFATLGLISPENIIPYNNGVKSELSMLTENIAKVIAKEVIGNNVDKNGNVWDAIGSEGNADFYYPAASICWAYEPIAQKLNDKFKAHNWFLPTIGDAIRISFYLRYISTMDADFDTLTSNFDKFKSITTGWINKLKSIGDIITSSEYIDSIGDINCAFKCNKNTQYNELTNFRMFKSTNASSLQPNNILPICKF